MYSVAEVGGVCGDILITSSSCTNGISIHHLLFQVNVAGLLLHFIDGQSYPRLSLPSHNFLWFLKNDQSVKMNEFG